MKHNKAFILTIVILVAYTKLLLAKNDIKVPADIARITAPFEMPQLSRHVFRDQVFNIKEHGAIVIGFEMSGGVQNLYAHDMEIKKNDRAVHIKSMPGRGGFVRNLTYENVKIGELNDAVVQINMKYGARTLKPKKCRRSYGPQAARHKLRCVPPEASVSAPEISNGARRGWPPVSSI